MKCPLPFLPSLYTLSFSENAITKFTDILIIQKLKTVYEVSVQGNQLDVEDPKIEILIFLPYMTKINDEEVTKADRDEAQKQLNERIEEAKRQAEEARQKQLEEEELAKQQQQQELEQKKLEEAQNAEQQQQQ
eukprot:TRINITY_DN7525_c0_g1_i2.p3 TRINITY_DN7525_c0_g1~~TRINITY_DN7525_c0_g1_i2.p3  ORF type:complete len:133 (+),score=47.02 TRINITY_DN7525_c0_g1_i2:807-1205(+)